MDSPTIFSPPRTDAPWWVLPLITFFAGAAIPFAVLMTVNSTPDFTRGHIAGFRAGRNDQTMHRDWYELGWNDHARGAEHRKFD